MHTPTPSPDDVVAATRRWLEKAVIGLNLCPFAKSVYIKDQVRFVVSSADSAGALQAALEAELLKLKEADATEVDTVLLIHPYVLDDFLDFNDFLDVVDMTVEALGLAGEFQVANFHPAYQFADASADDISNYTNRAPYPTLHLLREASIDRAVDAFPDAADIFERNIETMQLLGKTGWDKLWCDQVTSFSINDTKQN